VCVCGCGSNLLVNFLKARREVAGFTSLLGLRKSSSLFA